MTAARTVTTDGGDRKPQLAPEVQLLGEFAGSGFKEAPSLARRPDGQVIQLPPLLQEVLSRADGTRDAATIAAEVSEAVHRRLTADDVRFLVDEKLAPMGLVTTPDTGAAPPATATPLLGLKFRTAVFPERVTNVIAAAFKPLFQPVLVVAFLAAFVAFDIWLFGFHGVAQPIRQTLVHPALMLLMLGIVIGSAAFHETGHAAGCAYGGARPGKMGCGLYLAWPAFYTDITDSYRLDRRGRLRADLGGIYFNVVSILVLGVAYALTSFEPLLLGAAVIHLEIGHQLIPVVRLDGYYIVSDLTGVPDLFGRIGPILRSAVPWRPVDPRVTVLKRWVRTAVTAWVVVLLPVLGAELVLILINLPRVYTTGYNTAQGLANGVGAATGRGDVVLVLTHALQIALLALPLAGIALMLARAGSGLGRVAARATAGRPALRAGAATLGVAVVGVLAYSWIPPVNHRPIGPHDRGTLGQSSTGASHVFNRAVTVDAPVQDGTDTPTRTASPHPASPGPTTPAGGATMPGSPSASPGAPVSPSARPAGADVSTSPSPGTSAGPSASSSPSATPSASASSTTSPSPTPRASVSASGSARP